LSNDPLAYRANAKTKISLALRTADQARTDFAAIEGDLEFLLQRINRLLTAADLWRAALLITAVSAVLGIVGIEAFWRSAFQLFRA
jgi:hypothetical protein